MPRHVLFFFQAEDGIRYLTVTGVQTCALPISVITGADVKKISDPFLVALKSPIHQWSLAVDRVRFVGEPVALVVAESRYLAEDAAELVQIEYAPLEAVIDPLAACKPDSPILHAEAKTNEISVRKFHYGDTKSAFEKADRVVK